MVVFALVATMALGAIGAGLISVSNTETTIAANYRQWSELGYAAEAGANAAISDLGRAASWTSVLTGAVRSPYCDTTSAPLLSSGERLDLSAQTTAFQTASDADARRGAD